MQCGSPAVEQHCEVARRLNERIESGSSRTRRLGARRTPTRSKASRFASYVPTSLWPTSPVSSFRRRRQGSPQKRQRRHISSLSLPKIVGSGVLRNSETLPCHADDLCLANCLTNVADDKHFSDAA